MRIAIDARLNAYRQGGISQYTRQLLAALAEVSPTDEFIALQHRDQLRPLAIAPNVIRRTALTPPHHRFEQWTLPIEVLLARPNVLHCPDFIAPVRRSCPAVVTIHDLAFMHYPEILDEAANAYYGQVKTNAPRADAIIAVSEATRQDIAQFLDIPIEQIDVIYEAAAPLYTKLNLREGEARVLNSTPVAADTFLLFVSTLEPRKNLPTLLRALRICLDRNLEAGYRLVVVGARGWRDQEIYDTVRDLKLGDHVLFTGAVGQYDLRWLYNACRLYINPSLYEGFGLPLLEAMACGAASLAAATSSLPEIGGDAARYVPPLDAEAWADEIEALWDDQDRRAELGRIGLARAQRFSWLRAARETMGVYKRAAERIVPTPTPRPLPMGEVYSDLSADQVPDVAIGRRAPPAPGGPRVCLRCGAEMNPGKMQHQLGIRTPGEETSDQVLAPRMWACATCGYVELVVDWAVAVKADSPTVMPADTTDEPAPLLEAVAGDATPAQGDLLPEPVPADIVLPQLELPPLEASGESVMNGHVSEHDTFDEVIASAPADAQPLEQLADAAADLNPDELAASETIADVPPEAPSEPVEQDGTEESATSAELAEPPSEVAVGDQADLEAPSAATQEGLSNGQVPRQRQPRGNRRASTAPKDAPESVPPKRRQSRSRRK